MAVSYAELTSQSKKCYEGRVWVDTEHWTKNQLR